MQGLQATVFSRQDMSQGVIDKEYIFGLLVQGFTQSTEKARVGFAKPSEPEAKKTSNCSEMGCVRNQSMAKER